MTLATEGVRHVHVALSLLIADAMSVVRSCSSGMHIVAPVVKVVKISMTDASKTNDPNWKTLDELSI